MGQLTVEAIQQEIAKDPELKKGLISSFKSDFTESLKSEGVILRSPDEEKEFLSNYEKNIIPAKVESEIGQKVRAVHDQYDNDLFELTGERKQPHEKTYDFLKRKMADLKKQKKDGNDDPVLADKIKTLENQIKEREGWVSPAEVAKIKDKHFKDNVNLRLGVNMDKRPLSIPDHITEERAKQEYVSKKREMLSLHFLNQFTPKEDNEGNVVYYLEDQIQIDTHTGKPLNEGQLLDKFYGADFVPEKKATHGAGSGKNGTQSKVDVHEASLKNKAQVIEHLNEKFADKGIKMGNTEYNKEYQRIIKDYAITE